MDAGESTLSLGEKLSLLAHLRKKSQGHLALKCKISRISVNRFFRGKSEIRASDFVQLLSELGIDVQGHLDEKIQNAMQGAGEVVEEPIYKDVAKLLGALEAPVRKTLIEQVLWWAKSSAIDKSNNTVTRLQGYINRQGA